MTYILIKNSFNIHILSTQIYVIFLNKQIQEKHLLKVISLYMFTN